MNLSESFQHVMKPIQRPVAIIALVASAFTMAGCASGGRLNLPEGNVGGLPVGRVINQNTNQNIYTAKKAARNEIAGSVRLTPCPIQREQPRTQGPGLGGVITGLFERTFSINTTVGVGPNGCANQSQAEQPQQPVEQSGRRATPMNVQPLPSR